MSKVPTADQARVAARDAHLAEIERVAPRLAAEPFARIAPLRAQAIARFGEVGMPGPREEAWRHVNLRPLFQSTFAVPEEWDEEAARQALALFTFAGLDATRLVFVNGRFAETLSTLPPLPGGAWVGSLRDALANGSDEVLAHLAHHAPIEDTPFTALNTAMFEDGALIVIPRGVVIEQPIHVLHLTVGPDPMITSPRTLALIGEGAQATLIESFAGHDTATHFTNAVSEIQVGPGAHVHHLKLQREGEDAFHVANTRAHLERDAHFASVNVTLGSQLTRNDMGARIDGEGAHCALDGLNMVSGAQWVDNHTLLDHAVPHCTSHQLYKSVLDDRATTVFNGRIIVRQDAQRTDAIQSNHSLLLSDTATAHTQPNLEIFADDVKCTHGATVGNLEEHKVYYLRTRGIGEAEARGLLTFAFANEIIERINVEPVREQLEAHLFARFHRPPESA
ncbi:Fe-S cluster assembly protein SufD [Candidatus Sumerlaeota bacterium]|nr:Fe-S cluster assembly protein SufD [Candidatus Sumerlaeota bacterium]